MLDLDEVRASDEERAEAERRQRANNTGDRVFGDIQAAVGGTAAPGLVSLRARSRTETPLATPASVPGVTTEPSREPHPTAAAGPLGDRVFNLVTLTFAGLILAILLIMVAVLVVEGHDTITRFGFGFLTSSSWDSTHDRYGAWSSIAGTVYTSVLALLIAAPVGVLVAVFLTEMAPRRVRFVLGFIVELLAAVPSIVYGLWALFILVPLIARYVQPWFLAHFGSLPIFAGAPIGLGYFTAAVILAIMILPTITSISRDVMLAVPNSQRDAMLALGGTRWETIWQVVIPAARSGIVGAIILALGRAVGETMAVQMVIGNSLSFSWSLFQEGTTMPATIVNQFAEASGLQRSALMELALILMVVAIGLNSIARFLVARTNRVGGRRSAGLLHRIPGAAEMLTRFGVRRAINLAGTALAGICLLLAVIPLGAMLYFVIVRGASALNWAFFTQLPAAAGSPGGGMASQIVGTLYLIGIACVVGLPVGLLSGIYLSRTRSIGFANSVRFVTDIVAGTPSIVAGIVAYALIVIPLGSFSALAGGVALGLLMFPTVTRATEETIKLVPATVREAGLALGFPEWKTMLRIILPAATNGIVTAIVLGIARVAGETAPLVFTAFGSDQYPGSPLTYTGALPLKIWYYATGPYDTWHQQAWAGALTLFSIIVILNLSARLLTYRLSKRVANSAA